MRAFDHDYVVELIARLNRIKPDAKPAWGRMTPPEMIGHLTTIIRATKGKGPEYPFRGNWLTTRIVAPLLLRGIIPMPRNRRGPEPLDAGKVIRSGDTETLHAELEDYLARVQAGEFRPPVHPMLGDIGIDGWARFHVIHFEHHLRQFGV